MNLNKGLCSYNSTLYLGIKVGSDAEMAPRIRFSAVPYAFNAAALDDVVATESATGFNLQGGTSSLTTLAFTTSGGALTFQPGVAEGLTLQSNGANGLTLDTGGNGAIDIGTNNATSVVFGNSGNNTSFTFNSGTGNITLSALNSANGLVYTSGTNGVLSQTAPTSGSQCLQSNNTNSALAWISCSISGTNYWQLVSGALSPFSSTADLLLGGNATTSARFAFTNDIGSGIPTASISANNGANATYLTGAGIFGTTNDQSLTIGSASTGNIQFYNANNVITNAGNLTLAGSKGINLTGAGADINFTGTGTNSITTAAGQAFALMPGVGAGVGVNTTSPLASFDIRGDSGTTATASVSGATSFAGLVVDNTGSGDLLTASKSGATKFTVLNNGNVQINNYTTNGGLLFTNGNGLVTQTAASSNSQCLLGGLTPTWGTCAIGTNEWQQISGAISPTTITDDMLLGGISTTSARFAFTNNIGAGTPTASISANNGANATYLTGAGLLATTNAQSLTLGSASTGNIQFYSSNNSITSGGNLTLAGTTGINLSGIGAGINFTGTGTDSITTAPGQILALMPGVGAGVGVNTTSPLASFDIRANSGITATASVSGATSFAGLVVNNSGSGDLLTASKSGATKFVVENNGNIGFAGTNTVLSTLASAATSAVTWTLPNATGNICISTNNCGFATGTNEWQQISGAISPTSITDDVLMGGNATTSAKFAFTADDGVGIPTASISANTGANATYLTGTGILATTIAQSLTLGSATTGNVMLHPGGGTAELTAYANGTVGIGTTASTLATLDVRANSGTLAIASISGATSFAGLVVDNSGAGDIFTASKSGTTKFVITSQGNIGIDTPIPMATLDIRGTSATTSVASISGNTNFAGLVVNNSGSGDLITASNAGRTKFLVSNNGNVFLGGDTISASGSGSITNGSPDVINALPDEGSLVPNAGFEANTSHSQLGDGWVPNASNSGTLILDTTQADAAQGTNSIKWTTTAINQSVAFYSACFPITGVGANAYDLGWAEKGSAVNSATVRGYVDEYTTKAGCQSNTGLTPSVAVNTTAIAATWAQSNDTPITPATGTTWARVHMYLASSASGVSTYIDSVRLIESLTTGGLDYAEDYPANPNNIPQPGQVVSIVASGSGTIVTPSDKYMDDSAIGVVSTNPGQVLNDGSMTNPVPIALAGRVPVNVSTSNGTIQVGDYLTSSNIPGVAVKATGAGPVIGTAMEEDTDTNTSNVTQITMFIKNTYYNGGNVTATVGLNLLSGVQDPSIILNLLQGIQTAGNSSLTSLTSGQTPAGLNYLYTAITAAASQSADIIGQVNATSSANSNIVNNAITGLNVNGSATVSADLHIQGNSLFEGILHVVDTLFANDFIANGVSEFFGNVIFHSGVTFTNTPVFDSNTAGFAVIKKGSDHVDVTFNEIYDQTPIINASITLNPITPTPSETLSEQETRENQIESSALNNIHYIIINRSTKGFTIVLQQPAVEDISFSWIALAVNSPMLFQSSGQNVQEPTPSEELSPSPIDTIIPTGIPVTPVESPTVTNILTPTPGG